MKTPAILLAGLLCLGAFAPALATSVEPKPLEEMVAEADQIVRAKVVAVEMVDGKGRPLIRVPLWTMWHYTLGHIREATLGSESLFLLKGERHAPVYPMDFQRPLEERAQIQSLMVAP